MTYRGYDTAGEVMQKERETYESILDNVGRETLTGKN